MTMEPIRQEFVQPYDAGEMARSGDLNAARGRAVEVYDNLGMTLVIASNNKAKSIIYREALDDEESTGTVHTVMSLGDLENLNDYLRALHDPNAIEEPLEDEITAIGNAKKKAIGYAQQLVERYQRFTNPPGIVVAIDDDFVILDDSWEGPKEGVPQPDGAIKALGAQERVTDNSAVADHYATLVSEHGYTLPDGRKVLNIRFSYAFAVAVLDPDTGAYRYYTKEHQVDGYLLEWDEDLYYEPYPIVWIPVLEEDPTISVGNAVEQASNGNRKKVEEIFGPLLKGIRDLTSHDMSEFVPA